MKVISLLFLVIAIAAMGGCDGSGQVMKDETNVKRTLPPGQKSQDVQIHIDK